MKNNHYVYYLIDPFSNVVFYVGKGVGRRMYQHEILTKAGKKSNNNRHLFNKINKILRNGGSIIYKIVCDNMDASTACLREQEEIRHIGRNDLKQGPLCNLTDGGEGQQTLSPEILARKRLKCAYPKSLKHRQNLSVSLSGRKLSALTIDKLKSRKINAWHYKHHHTEETKAKMGLSRKGKTWEEIYGVEEAGKMRVALKERHQLGIMPRGGKLEGKPHENRS